MNVFTDLVSRLGLEAGPIALKGESRNGPFSIHEARLTSSWSRELPFLADKASTSASTEHKMGPESFLSIRRPQNSLIFPNLVDTSKRVRPAHPGGGHHGSKPGERVFGSSSRRP